MQYLRLCVLLPPAVYAASYAPVVYTASYGCSSCGY